MVSEADRLLQLVSDWTSTVGSKTDPRCSPDGAMIDLWNNEGPAPPHQPGVYQEQMFVEKAQSIMRSYASNATARVAGPLFLYCTDIVEKQICLSTS